jgi:hypothetical protein
MMHRLVTSLLFATSLLYICMFAYAFSPLVFGDKAAEAEFLEAAQNNDGIAGEKRGIIHRVDDINVFSVAHYVHCRQCERDKEFVFQYSLKPGPFIIATAAFVLCLSLLLFLRPPRISGEQAVVVQLEPALGNIIEGLRYRARRLRRGAAIGLVLIVTSLIIGIGIFLSAGYLASTETISLNPLLRTPRRLF